MIARDKNQFLFSSLNGNTFFTKIDIRILAQIPLAAISVIIGFLELKMQNVDEEYLQSIERAS